MKALKTLVMLVGAMVVGAALWDWLGPKPPAPTAPLIPSRATAPAPPRAAVSTETILRWGLDDAPIAVANMATDALPNGLALAMLSIVVDWERSRLEVESPYVLLRHVRIGGNPVTGRNVLGTVRVPLDGFEDVQWCLTPNRSAGGRDTVSMGHAMLRFLFSDDDRATVEGLADMEGAAGIAPRIDDLLLSWEAWRPPQTPYDPVASLDANTYSLTVRGYTGAQRFLDDAVRGNPWVCYPLALPETDDAHRAVFLVAVAMGDSLLRRVLHSMAEDGTLDRSAIERLVAELDEARLARLQAVYAPNEVTGDPMAALLGQADLSYQLLERSCITQSLTAVQWALQRLHRKHELGPAPRLEIVPDGLPPWINDLAHAPPAEMAARLPGALWYIARNQRVLPGKAWQILQEAGLLKEQRNGGVLSYYYDPRDQTPYGAIEINLM
jgi:hypothetical protein